MSVEDGDWYEEGEFNEAQIKEMESLLDKGIKKLVAEVGPINIITANHMKQNILAKIGKRDGIKPHELNLMADG